MIDEIAALSIVAPSGAACLAFSSVLADDLDQSLEATKGGRALFSQIDEQVVNLDGVQIGRDDHGCFRRKAMA